MGKRIPLEQQKRLVKIFNEWGFFPEKPVHLMTWKEYSYYVTLYHQTKNHPPMRQASG